GFWHSNERSLFPDAVWFKSQLCRTGPDPRFERPGSECKRGRTRRVETNRSGRCGEFRSEMNKSRIIASAIVSVIVAGIAFFAFRSREPVYQGRPLSAWLEDLDYGRPSFRREAVGQAEAAVRQIGTNAVPFLVGMMRCKDSPFRKKMVALCSKQSFIKFNFRPAADTLQWR